MQAPNISPTLLPQAAPSAKAGAPASNESDAFSRVLTREVAEREPRQDKPATEARNGESAPPPPSSTEASDKDTADAPASETASAIPAEMLALVASITHFQGGAAQVRPTGEVAGEESLPAGHKRAAPLNTIGAAGRDPGLETGTDEVAEDLLATRGDTGKTQTALLPLQAAASGATRTGLPVDDFNATLKEVSQLLQPMQQPAASQAAANAAADKLAPRVGSPDWDQALGQKIVWMVNGEQQTASLELNPPELGPLKVVLQISNAQANASFVAAQPEVRQALEAAMPRLRDMLGEAGIQLGQASVDSGTQQQQQNAGQTTERGTASIDATAATETPAPVTQVRAPSGAAGRGLVDTFA